MLLLLPRWLLVFLVLLEPALLICAAWRDRLTS